MATPTPMKHAPSQQGRTPSQHVAAATPPVSTPFSSSHAHAAFSPHRSSPHHFKKSPANSSTLLGHPGSVPANFDSPSAAAFGALEIGGGLGLGLDGVGVVGLGGLGLARADDDERAKRLHAILDILSQTQGQVSEAGLDRLAKAMGLECMWEEGMGAVRSRTLIVAGAALAVEIVLSNNLVRNVSLTYPESNASVMKHVERANQILLDDLKLPPRQSPLTHRLARFSENLERLAVLDRLSVIPSLNLHEAVAGVLESLEKLYNWDLSKLQEDPAMSGKSEESLKTTVLCARHGLPSMHARGRVGLSLDYWLEKRLVPATTETTKAIAADEKTWSVLIGCAPMGELAYQPVRISDAWLSNDVEKLTPTAEDLLSVGNGPLLDWQEPPDAILQSIKTEDTGGLSGDPSLAAPKLPEVIFNARFDPPVTVPFSVWHQIYQLVGLTPGPDFAPVTFDSLNFPVSPSSNHDPSEPRVIKGRKHVQSNPKNGERPTTSYTNTLFVYKPVYGRTLSELPFSHPSQLVRMLPYLRQYAFLSTLLENSFDAKMADIVSTGKEDKSTETVTVRDEYSHFMTENGDPASHGERGEQPRQGGSVFMDVVLTAHPVPRLQVVFPFRNRTADVMLEIRINGLVHVVSQNVLDDADGASEAVGKGKSKELAPQDLGRVLEVCEDLGIWCEWIRRRCE